MNPAHYFLFFIALILAWTLGLFTGADKDNEFFPTGVSFLFVFACVVFAGLNLFFIVYPLL